MQTKRLIEPFAGSAAVTLAAARLRRARRFLLNDIHAPLMELWRRIVLDPEGLVKRYRAIWCDQLGDERAYYDAVRTRFNRQHRPEDFLYLLARCVKAAIRYNSNGEFNNSPDNRRRGAHPDTMERHIRGASKLLFERTVFRTGDYKRVLLKARPCDVVYMDPPYQGVCRTHNHRYVEPIALGDFVDALAELNTRDIPFIVSHDGRTGSKRFGAPLPVKLGLLHVEIPAGRSTQATLLGRDDHTYESLYLSPALLEQNGGKIPGNSDSCLGEPRLFPEAV